MRNGSFMRIVNDQLDGKGPKHFPELKFYQQTVMVSVLSGDLPFSITFWNLTRPPLPKFIASNQMKCTFSYASCNWHQLIDQVQFCFMIMLGPILSRLTMQKLKPTWDTRLCHIHHISLISHQLTTTFSSILTIL